MGVFIGPAGTVENLRITTNRDYLSEPGKAVLLFPQAPSDTLRRFSPDRNLATTTRGIRANPRRLELLRGSPLRSGNENRINVF